MIREKAYRRYAFRIGIGIMMLAILLSSGGTDAFSSYDNGNWRNYREITITENSGSTLTDYQVRIPLSGDDFPANARPDGGDIRFTDMSGNELSYWIENWNQYNRNALLWVKVPSIPANSNIIIRMYYGNSNASPISNGDNTFNFFDDFEGTSIDGTKWFINYGKPSVSDGVLSLSGSVISEKTTAFEYDYIFESRLKMSDTGKEPRSFLRSTNNSIIIDGSDRFEFGSWTKINEMSLVNANNNNYNIVANSEKFPTSFEILGMARLNTRTEAFRQYVSKLKNFNHTPNIPLYLQLYTWEGESLFVDWVRVRKYISLEPTISIGSETTSILTPISTPTITLASTSVPIPTSTTKPPVDTQIVVAIIGAFAAIITAYLGYKKK